MPRSSLMLSPEIRKALTPLAHEAPGGYEALATLSDHTLMLAITHPDVVKVVEPDRYLIDLSGVNEVGYGVYDSTFTLSHLIQVDPGSPDVDLTSPLNRSMRFGRSLLDLNFMLHRKHGDVFYISYETGSKLPRVVMVIVIDRAIVKKEAPDASLL